MADSTNPRDIDPKQADAGVGDDIALEQRQPPKRLGESQDQGGGQSGGPGAGAEDTNANLHYGSTRRIDLFDESGQLIDVEIDRQREIVAALANVGIPVADAAADVLGPFG